MTPFWGEDDLVAEWTALHIDGCERGFGNCRAMGVADKTGTICAGVVFHNWWPEHEVIEMSAAATNPRWWTRRVANEIMRYGFGVARLMLVRTAESNAPARRLCNALGGNEYLIPDLWKPGEAMAVITLTPEQWQKSRLYDVEAERSKAA